MRIILNRLIFAGAITVLAILGLKTDSNSGETTVGVTCSCDPPGKYRPPGFNCRALCAPGSSSGSSGGFGGGSMQQQILGTMFNSFTQGFAQGLQSNAQQQQQQQEMLQRQMEQHRRALREELDRQEDLRRQQAEFERERNQAHRLLKGPKPTESFGLKGAGDPQDLGIKDSRPANEKRDVSSQWKRLHCAAYLSDLSQAARKRGDEEEAAYLTEQVGQVMSGGNVGVKCPEAPPRPQVLAAKTEETPQARFYQTLLESTKQNLDELAAVNERLKELQVKNEEAAKRAEQKRQEVERLKRQPVQPGTPPAPNSVIDEALAALQESERAEQEADRALKQGVGEQQKILQALDQKKALYQEVEKNPQAADKALARLKK